MIVDLKTLFDDIPASHEPIASPHPTAVYPCSAPTLLMVLLERLSDLTLRNHLLAQVALVLADGTLPPLDGLVLANHDFLGDLVEQSRCHQSALTHPQTTSHEAQREADSLT